jgi:hypothetical protein
MHNFRYRSVWPGLSNNGLLSDLSLRMRMILRRAVDGLELKKFAELKDARKWFFSCCCLEMPSLSFHYLSSPPFSRLPSRCSTTAPAFAGLACNDCGLSI